jgi:uncharacterized 2Fe-2S/4Fe-4S cluster protein (DUF4445 family)
MPEITLKNKILHAEKGEKLSDILMKSGIYVDHPCGGKGMCKKCAVLVNGKAELSCQYVVNSDIEVTLPQTYTIVSETGIENTFTKTENMCFCLDIGTTTLALALVSLDNEEVINTVTRTNPQKIYGADVISRIEYCRNTPHIQLHKILVDEINSMIEHFNIGEILPLFVSGNTTMLHFFFNADPSGIGVAPYTPVFLKKQTRNGEDIGLNGIGGVESLPCISAFVGADIVAGLNCVDYPEEGKYNMLIDLGTNAEIALFSGNEVVCTSAAAGPCFEGANISCGMNASEGAVYAYSASGYKTVGNVLPKGICGTGLVDIVAHLLFTEIDETGYMENEEFEIADGVSFSQSDVRQYQLAKSAVFSAVETILKHKCITYDDVEKVYISGGFSEKINIANAVKTGLIPKNFESKCTTINNSSLLGTIKYACGKNETDKIVKNASYLDLSSDENFSQLFIENMMFYKF